MNKLAEKIKKINKGYFTFIDLLKISEGGEGGLKVALNRLVKKGEIIRISKGVYARDPARIDWEALANEIYAPSYLSCEWMLAQAGILSQKPAHLTLATVRRSKVLKTDYADIIYRHIQPKLFWGYHKRGGALVADKEKAFLDLAYFSLNGYAGFDPGEMNLKLLDKKLLQTYLKRFKNSRLHKLIGGLIRLI